MVQNLTEFMAKFQFQPRYHQAIGVERECFVALPNRRIVPYAARVIEKLQATNYATRFTHELSACQIESKTFPTSSTQVDEALEAIDATLASALGELGLMVIHDEVGPADMPLDVSPVERYREIAEKMPPARLRAACRIIATHVHVGMPDHRTALRVYNRVIGETPSLIAAGDGSDGERLRIYETVAPSCHPRPYRSWKEFYNDGLKRGFANDPRNNWQLVRISPRGSIEFRMFGTTPNPAKAARWARSCHTICMNAL